MKKEQYKKLWDSQVENPKVYQVLWFDLLNASGWAGVLPNGTIVDRRYFDEAISVQENSMFGVNKPKEICGEKSYWFITINMRREGNEHTWPVSFNYEANGSFFSKEELDNYINTYFPNNHSRFLWCIVFFKELTKEQYLIYNNTK